MADDAFRDVYEVLIDCRDASPVLVFRFHKASFKIGDHGVFPVFAEIVADLFRLGAIDEGFLKATHNLRHVLMEGFFFAVVVYQVFEHVARKFVHTRVDCVRLVDRPCLGRFLSV